MNSITITIHCHILWMAPAFITMITTGLFCDLPTKKQLCHPGKVTLWEETPTPSTISIHIPFSLLSPFLSLSGTCGDKIPHQHGVHVNWHQRQCPCLDLPHRQDLAGVSQFRSNPWRVERGGFHLKLNSELTTMGVLEKTCFPGGERPGLHKQWE